VTDPLAPARTYQLLIEVAAPVRVRVGRLGEFDFPAGHYVYTGSALRNFEARVDRHLAQAKKIHWHIDYLLGAPGVSVREVRRHGQAECAVNQQVRGEITVSGFGASDCRSGCGSHLKRLASLPDAPDSSGRDQS
jgi:Uri superfamily endonuclease